mgnify:CR=1 FL=1
MLRYDICYMGLFDHGALLQNVGRVKVRCCGDSEVFGLHQLQVFHIIMLCESISSSFSFYLSYPYHSCCLLQSTYMYTQIEPWIVVTREILLLVLRIKPTQAPVNSMSPLFLLFKVPFVPPNQPGKIHPVRFALILSGKLFVFFTFFVSLCHIDSWLWRSLWI